jgi:hypothetical protein
MLQVQGRLENQLRSLCFSIVGYHVAILSPQRAALVEVSKVVNEA